MTVEEGFYEERMSPVHFTPGPSTIQSGGGGGGGFSLPKGVTDFAADVLGDVAKGVLGKIGLGTGGRGGGTYSAASTAVSVNPAITVIGGSGYANPSTSGSAMAPITQPGTYGAGRPPPLADIDQAPFSLGDAAGDDTFLWLIAAGVGAFVLFGGLK